MNLKKQISSRLAIAGLEYLKRELKNDIDKRLTIQKKDENRTLLDLFNSGIIVDIDKLRLLLESKTQDILDTEIKRIKRLKH